MIAPAIGLSFYALLMAIELIILKFVKKQELPLREVITNINTGHILLWVSRALVLSIYYFVLTNWSFQLIVTWPIWLKWLFAFVFWDFSYYWMHRTHHRLKWLWKVHVVHHQGEHYNLSLGIRNSWFQSLTSFPFFVWFAFIGLPLEIYVAVSAIQITMQFYNHNGVVGSQGILEKFMVTPTHHKIHHGINEAYLDKNHGGVFIIWDKLFGTFATAKTDVPIVYGSIPKFTTYNPAEANLDLFSGHDDVHEHIDEQSKRYPAYYTFLSGFVLYAAMLVYIQHEKLWTNNEHIFLVYMLLSGTVFIGGFSNGSRNMMLLWILNSIALPILFLWQMQTVDNLFTAMMLLLSATGFWGILLMKATKERESVLG